jgi:hypothetical protein
MDNHAIDQDQIQAAAEHAAAQAIADIPDTQAISDAHDARVAADLADVHRTQECYVCQDQCDLSRILQIDCGAHWLCHECVLMVFEDAINNEAHYPPSCCQLLEALFIEDFKHIIKDADLVKRYEAKTEEYRTHVMFRRYCTANACYKAFLPITTYEDVADGRITVAQCVTCANYTCISCLEVIGPSGFSKHDCHPRHPRLDIQYDRSNGRMKACPYCGEGVELSEGCNHMTCRCGNQWCFECLLPWATQEDHVDCLLYNEPEYDADGYSTTRGLHRDTGLDREGFNGRGVNIRGLNRWGQRVPNFAYVDRNRFVNGAANRPQGLLDINEEDFREAAMLQLIQEVENGLVLQSDDLEHEIERHFGVIQQQNFNIHGNHHNNHHHGHGDQQWGDDNDGADDNDGGWGNDQNGRGDDQDQGGWEDHGDFDDLDNADILVADDDDERQFENDALDGAQQPVDDGWGGIQQGAELQGDADLVNMLEQANLLENVGEPRNNDHANEHIVNRPETADANGDNEIDDERDPPIPQSLVCQHNWDVMADAFIVCEACGQYDADANFCFFCSICQTFACVECYTDFAAMARIYFPKLVASEDTATADDATAPGAVDDGEIHADATIPQAADYSKIAMNTHHAVVAEGTVTNEAMPNNLDTRAAVKAAHVARKRSMAEKVRAVIQMMAHHPAHVQPVHIIAIADALARGPISPLALIEELLATEPDSSTADGAVGTTTGGVSIAQAVRSDMYRLAVSLEFLNILVAEFLGAETTTLVEKPAAIEEQTSGIDSSQTHVPTSAKSFTTKLGPFADIITMPLTADKWPKLYAIWAALGWSVGARTPPKVKELAPGVVLVEGIPRKRGKLGAMLKGGRYRVRKGVFDDEQPVKKIRILKRSRRGLRALRLLDLEGYGSVAEGYSHVREAGGPGETGGVGRVDGIGARAS